MNEKLKWLQKLWWLQSSEEADRLHWAVKARVARKFKQRWDEFRSEFGVDTQDKVLELWEKVTNA